MSDLDIARAIKRDLNNLIDHGDAKELLPSVRGVQEYINRKSPSPPNQPTEDDLFAAFQAGFALGRQPQQLPGPWGTRMRNAFDRWRK